MHSPQEAPIYLQPFWLSLSKPKLPRGKPFDKPVLSHIEGLRANGLGRPTLLFTENPQ
jgi:hypothetical protein